MADGVECPSAIGLIEQVHLAVEDDRTWGAQSVAVAGAERRHLADGLPAIQIGAGSDANAPSIARSAVPETPQ